MRRVVNKFLKKKYRIIIEDYGRQLASDQITTPDAQKDCHLAKLVVYDNSEYDLRSNSLSTLVGIDPETAIPHILFEISLLTKRRPERDESKVLAFLYSILAKKCNP